MPGRRGPAGATAGRNSRPGTLSSSLPWPLLVDGDAGEAAELLSLRRRPLRCHENEGARGQPPQMIVMETHDGASASQGVQCQLEDFVPTAAGVPALRRSVQT
jgi:hypothetical protein